MIRSLRTRLIVGIISAILLLLTAFSLVVYAVIRRALINQFDTSLESTVRILAASIEIDGDKVDLEVDVQRMPEFQRSDRPAYYQLWWDDGAVAMRSPSLGDDDLLRLEGSLGVPVFRALQTRTGLPGRAVGLRFRPKNSSRDTKQQTLTLVVARDATELQAQLSFLRRLLLVASIATIILSFLVAAFVVRQGLNPLNSIASEIAAVREDNLTARIGTGGVPMEIVPIKSRLNELLSRLEASFNRERRFTADVAHELRTPLAGMRSTLEVTLTRIRDVNEYQASLSDCLTISKNMQRMVDNLLTLTRLDAHQITFRRARIELAELVNCCWLSFSDRALQREIVFENRVPPEITCESDPENLSMVMSNLLDNAVEYTNKGGRIWTTARQAHDFIEITVSNTGCKLTNEDTSQVFDCFWRGDSSRTDTGAHCGLGLGLAQRIIRALGGSISAEVHPGGIFTVRLTLPDMEESRSVQSVQ